MHTRPTILVVEDNLTEQKLMTLLLEKFGYDAVIESTGYGALYQIQHRADFAVILMDWQMGVMNGLDCTKQIREFQKQTGRFTPIVAVTARAMLGDKQICLNAGMDDYLSKPFTTQQLQSMLEHWASPNQALTG